MARPRAPRPPVMRIIFPSRARVGEVALSFSVVLIPKPDPETCLRLVQGQANAGRVAAGHATSPQPPISAHNFCMNSAMRISPCM